MRRWPCPSTAHPRAGGENVSALSGDDIRAGSSPRGRGKQIQFLESRAFDGLIPARAGKTLSIAEVIRPIGAHPRAGGENSVSERVLGG